LQLSSRAPPATAPKLALSEAQLRDFTEVIVSSVNKFSETLYVVGVSKDKVLILKVNRFPSSPLLCV
jgi:hypothetical protein